LARTYCPNCDAELKIGMVTANMALSEAQLRVINAMCDDPWAAACNKCGDDAHNEARKQLHNESAVLKNALQRVLPRIPIVSLQSPMGWTYEPIGVVTGQTVTGTGMFSDVASAFTDLFGAQSGTYNAKLRDGENLCKAQLRGQTIELGGNAVLAVDIDYAEVGGQRAMLMVCMTGTAVRITGLSPPDDPLLADTAEAMHQARRVREIEGLLGT
jgi:uncharacterized protein YbjQ (UPF0145 family)